jgi:hypothetical protein
MPIRLTKLFTYREMNSNGVAERYEFRLLPAEVALHLINSRGNTGYSNQVGQLLRRKIAHPYGASFARIIQTLHRLPGLGNIRMHKVFRTDLAAFLELKGPMDLQISQSYHLSVARK